MTAKWRLDFNPDNLYFVTTTAVGHARIFERDLIKRIAIDSLYHTLITDQSKIFAFVVMPNHLHFITQHSSDKPLKDFMRDFKSTASRLIVRQFQVERNEEVLNFLKAAVTRREKQEYKVWEDNYNAKEVFSPEFLRQKMEYMHNNPLQPHWNLVDRPEDYIWSSARFYLLNELALIPLANANGLF
jgi:putative transposase